MIGTPSEAQQALYRRAFVQKCLILIIRAHSRLNAKSLTTAEEPHITGELVKSARDVLESEEAEQWMEDIEIHDDPPQNAPNRHGKRRHRIDIEFVTTGRGRRPRFKVEAKRLYRADSVNEYFGAGGLQMFVQGHYAPDWPSAGMLGYVQSEKSANWLRRLAAGLTNRGAELGCAKATALESAHWNDEGLDGVRVSLHQRTPESLGGIVMFHLLLEFV